MLDNEWTTKYLFECWKLNDILLYNPSAFALPTGTPSLGDLHGYLLQNRNSYNGGFSYDVFLHTNTGCETFDHTRWASWSGQVWGIDASIFGHDSPDKL